MANELQINDSFNGFEVSFTRGSVEIVGYNEIYQQLSELSNYLNNIDVTEDNIKENKKLVARVSKAVKEMNDARIENKRKFIAPFTIYEGQVKALTELVKGAEQTVRDQIHELEEKERQEKEELLKTIFQKRKKHFTEYGDFMEFENYLEPQYLNKSYSINKAEEKMAEWFKRTNTDIELLNTLADKNNFKFMEGLNVYLDCGDITQTLDYFAKKNKREEELQEVAVQSKLKPIRGTQERWVSLVIKESDVEQVQNVLTAMGIEFKCV